MVDFHSLHGNAHSMLLWRRYKSNYFSRHPLNYESLTKRAKKFRTQEPSPLAVRDYIVANRRLQEINRIQNLRFSNKGKFDLDINLNVSSSQLENELWDFIAEHWLLCIGDELIVKKYLAPHVDMSRAFQMVTENFTHNLSQGKQTKALILYLVNLLLQRGDYDGCFKIIDLTYGSAELLRYKKFGILRKLLSGAIISLAMGIFQFVCMPLLPTFPLLLLDFGVVFGTMHGLDKIKHGGSPGRVIWRPYTKFSHRILHADEIMLINRMVTYFEEHNEVNVKNYHHSLIRNISTLETLQQHDFELQLPNSTELTMDTMGGDEKVEGMAKYFRTKLHKRQIIWKPMKEEQMFIDFWVSHGENYEWVEPDQDPSEMVLFR